MEENLQCQQKKRRVPCEKSQICLFCQKVFTDGIILVKLYPYRRPSRGDAAERTEWGANPRAQGTVKLLLEISQIRHGRRRQFCTWP